MNPLTNTARGWLLFGAALLQCLLLTGMVAVSALPMWTGEEIRVKTVPVDPRSLFRGNYARLRYEFSSIELAGIEKAGSATIRRGHVGYVLLEKNGELYEYSGWSDVRPDSGVFLRARVRSVSCRNGACRLQLKLGIEAFFAPKAEALDLEKRLRSSGIAVLMVSDSGRARLKAVVADAQ